MRHVWLYMLVKTLQYIGFGILVVVVAGVLYLFVGSATPAAHITWGVNFSERHSMSFGLDWKAVYVALLDDLGAKDIKTLMGWDLLEPTRDSFTFQDLDFQTREAERANAELIVVIGMKTGRWPECHIPEWAKGLSKEEQQEEILELLTATVTEFKSSPAIMAWQVENEAMFPFGDCPWYDTAFLKKEVALVKSLDPVHPVIVSDSGEVPLWWKAATIGDIVGTTLYRTVWFTQLDRYLNYPLPPVFYGRKAALVKALFGKDVWNVELQAEPWGQTLLYDLPLEEQRKTMTPEKFAPIVEYARQTGLDTFYLWGAEWWYWMREKHNDPGMWDAAEALVRTGSDCGAAPCTGAPVGALSEFEARRIAEATCIKGGEALAAGVYNSNSKTWWFDANLNATREGCSPACVVDEGTRTAEVNWRCTGLVVPE